ncbi:AlpA family phage regulatory protein [Streptomyces sp. NPDC008139]|uniref:helix-turn-helix transcriptional regulator n=1 Tax=Streptomyces sp. NPDC008139 TaxID=3364814 RepID=UPI0036EA3873
MTTPPPRTGGLTEVGEILGVSRQRAYTLAKRQDFPVPVATSKAGRTWDLDVIEAWMANWDRENKGGRPKTGQPAAEPGDGADQ